MKRIYLILVLFILFSGCDRDICDCEPDEENRVLTEAVIVVLDTSEERYKRLEGNKIAKKDFGIYFDIDTELQKPETPKCPCREANVNFYTEWVVYVNVYFHDLDTGKRILVNDKLAYVNSVEKLSFKNFEALLLNPKERQLTFYNNFTLVIDDSKDLPENIRIEIVTQTHLGNTFRVITETPIQLLD